MTQHNLTQTAIFLLRLTLGIMFIAHSIILKLMVFTLPGTAQFFQSIGLAAWLAYAVFSAEAVGGIMLVLGIQARWTSLMLVPILVGAAWVHIGNGWVFSNPNSGWEYAAYLTILAVAQFMLGDGRFALVKSSGLPGNSAYASV